MVYMTFDILRMRQWANLISTVLNHGTNRLEFPLESHFRRQVYKI